VGDRPMQVYISSTKDVISTAKRLAKSLESRNFEVFLPPRDLQPGADYPQIKPEIRKAEAFLVLIGPNFERSVQLEREWVSILEEASGLTKKLIPLRVGSAELPTFLKRWEDIRVPSSKDEESWDKFVDTIADALDPKKKLKLKPPLKEDLEAWEQRMSEIASFANDLKKQGL
jgi:hypothetical protein